MACRMVSHQGDLSGLTATRSLALAAGSAVLQLAESNRCARPPISRLAARLPSQSESHSANAWSSLCPLGLKTAGLNPFAAVSAVYNDMIGMPLKAASCCRFAESSVLAFLVLLWSLTEYTQRAMVGGKWPLSITIASTSLLLVSNRLPENMAALSDGASPFSLNHTTRALLNAVVHGFVIT